MLEVVVKFVLHMVINLHVNYVGSMAMLLLVIGICLMKPLHLCMLSPTYQKFRVQKLTNIKHPHQTLKS